MDQEGHSDLFHARKHAIDFLEIGDAVSRIGSRVRRIHFHRGEHTVAESGFDIIRIGLIGEIAGHQRLEF